MKNLSDISLNQEQYELVEKLAAANYSARDIAIYLKLDIQSFKKSLEDKDSVLYLHYYRGQLVIKAGIDIGLANAAASGKITAIQVQMKRKSELDFEAIKKEIFNL